MELSHGSISIDGIEIAKMDLEELRSSITFIAQEPHLFEGSVKYNLDPRGEHSRDELEAVLLKVGLHNLFAARSASSHDLEQSSLEFGTYETSDEVKGTGIFFNLSEGGMNLSDGERQLLCICRAALQKNSLVIIDEATACLD